MDLRKDFGSDTPVHRAHPGVNNDARGSFGRPAHVVAGDVGRPLQDASSAEIVLAIDTWRWAGVPFRVRSGKALGSPRTEVTVTLKQPQQVPVGLTGFAHPDRLHIGIALEDNMLGFDLNISGRDDPFRIDPVTLTGDFGSGELPPYGEVLKGILEGMPPLSVRGDMAVQCWRIIEPVRQAWRENRVPLQDYEAGSTGPDGWPVSGLPAGRT